MTALLPSEILSRAADLIEPEGAWTTRELARDAKGRAVEPREVGAVCWCSAGAMMRHQGPLGENHYPALRYLERVVGSSVTSWNDQRATQPTAVAALRKASDLAKAEGQ